MSDVVAVIQLRHPMRSWAYGDTYYQKKEVVQEIRKLMTDFLAEMQRGQLNLEVDGESYVAKFEISVTNDTYRKRRIEWRDWGICTVTVNIDSDRIIKKFEKNKLPEGLKTTDLANDLICTEFKSRVYELCIAFNLAYPGIFEMKEADIFYNGYKEHMGNCYSNLLNIYLKSKENHWADLSILSAAQVWKWINTKTGFSHGVSSNSIERALNALTYTFNPTQYEDLLYCMMGIESILNSNKSDGVLEQIREKCKILFGDTINKKSVSSMYNIRSRFIHGELNFPSKFTFYDATDEYWRFISNDYSKTRDIAVSILVALIQKYIINNAGELVTTLNLTFK